MKEKNIAAFFDIDGTIYREGLITEVFKKIIKYELVDETKWYKDVRPSFIKWDKRQGGYDEYLLKMVDIYTESHIGIISPLYVLLWSSLYIVPLKSFILYFSDISFTSS